MSSKEEVVPPKLVNVPKHIWLQVGWALSPDADRAVDGEVDFNSIINEDTTWCQDEIEQGDVPYVLATEIAEKDAEIEGLKSELSDAHLLVHSTQETIDKARQAAGHVEEAREVCIPDCPGCIDPVGSLIADLKESRRLHWFERLANKGAVEYQVELEGQIETLRASQAAEIIGSRKAILGFLETAVDKLGFEEGSRLTIGHLQAQLEMTKPFSEIRKDLESARTSEKESNG